MARTFTKFTLDPGGNLVYKSTGAKAPKAYTVRGTTVYGKNGRKIGTVSKKLTKAESQKVSRAYANRLKRSKALKGPAPSQRKPRAPGKKARQQPRIPDEPDVRSTDFPEPEFEDIVAFTARVKEAAEAIADAEWMIDEIRGMDPNILWDMFENGEYVLELYFMYYENEPPRSKKAEYARWFINVYRAYRGTVRS